MIGLSVGTIPLAPIAVRAYARAGGRPGASAFRATRVSVDSTGAQTGRRCLVSISSDGQFVVFESDADDLVAGDRNSVRTCSSTTDRRDDRARERRLVGNEGDRESHGSYQAISDDGMQVVFRAARRTSIERHEQPRRRLRRPRERTTVLVSVDSSGVVGNANSFSPAISGGGRFVVFTSFASKLVANDSNGETDVFLRDLASGTTERVSVDSAGNQGDGGCLYSSVSSDGGIIAFESGSTNLVAGDTNGCNDVFVRDRQAGTTERVSVDSNGAQVQGFSMWPSVSADGAFVAYGPRQVDSRPRRQQPAHGHLRPRPRARRDVARASTRPARRLTRTASPR